MSASVTPHASANPSFLITSSSTPAPPPPAATPLPSPYDFDVLPDLHNLLGRLQLIPTQLPDSSQPSGGQAQPPSDNGPLEIHQLSTVATEIKLKVQGARKKIMALPDIDRTCEDQQEEITELEERIGMLKDVLKGLGQPTTQGHTMSESEQEQENEEADDNDMSMVG